MKIVIINKSDSTGGAAVVSRRLMEALRGIGVDARMLVVEKLTDSPYVELAASPRTVRKSFLAERLKIFIANGFNRSTLFKIDTASDGLPLWNHPLVKDADAVLLNWVNQGMLSLQGVEKILQLGKPVVWTMHDMWCMTGVCHHAGECDRYLKECGDCPLLEKMGGENDISHKTWRRKHNLGNLTEKIKYVAVSNWLAEKAKKSSLLNRQSVTVIPNAFHIPDNLKPKVDLKKRLTILFGAARLDDPIKNLPALIEMTRVLKTGYPELTSRLELVTFGNVKNPAALEGIAIPHRHLGMVKGEEAVRQVYENADILVSSSSYETLPGTLVEAQAYGCIPVSFNQGGQSDIVDHLSTGYIAEYSSDITESGHRLAEGISWAVNVLDDPANRVEILHKMRESVTARFSPEAIAKAYLRLLNKSL
ncbi:MAG: glycosyltransferase [Muribaculaceae bacterium]|nr:glycosyltransferase [Muribaculaceae bacterium]